MMFKERLMKSLPKDMSLKVEPKVQMKVNDGSAELYLYGDIIEDSYVWDKSEEYISSKKVREQLSKLNGENLKVHINSFGGMTFEGVAIYNLLMDYQGEVEVQIDGIAASAASIVAMAGSKISGRENTMLMIHKGWTYAMGNSTELRESADMLDKIDKAADATYLKRFKGEPDELAELISAETWLTATECLENGFYDSVIEELAEPDEEPKTNKDEPKPELNTKTLFDLWKEQKEQQSKKENLLSKFKGEK